MKPPVTDKRSTEVEALKQEIAALRAELTATQAILAEKDAQLQRILHTLGWRVLSRYGRFKHGVLLPALDAIRGRRRAGAPALSTSGASAAREITYEEWAKACEAVRYDPGRAARRVALLASRPRISVVTPVYDTPAEVLEAAIRSVRDQLYPEWELCLYDDASPSPHVRKILERHAAEEPRVKVRFGERNGGISAALNGALSLATGDWVAFLDHDDALTPDALLEMASAIEETNADVLYSDEDKYDARGRRHDAFFKPDWSPDLFLSIMYTCHLTVMRRDLVERAGGFREGLEGSQDYDLWLRATELTSKVAHVPMVLYHWRQVAGSTATDIGNKGYAHERSKRAIGEAIRRRGIEGTVGDGPAPTTFHVVRHVADEPLVSILIPTRDRVDLLATAIRGIEERTDYPSVEIVVVDNGSRERETLDYLASLRHKVIRVDAPFNFSRLNNLAARESRGDLLLLLNNDTEPADPGWLRAMAEHAVRPEVGAVGAKLLYPSGKVQHAGVVLGIGGVAGHSHKHFPKDDPGYFQALRLVRDASAVTGACMMVRREVFEEVGGLDEVNLAVAFNDVDFCLRLRERGYLVVWTPYAVLTHFESESRGYDLNPHEIDYMIRRWGEQLVRDPYYNPNLTLVHEDYGIDVTRPDGYLALPGQSASGGPAVEAGGGARAAASFRSSHDGLGGVILELEEGSARDGVLRLALHETSAVGAGPGRLVAEVEVPLAAATPWGDVWALFDAPVRPSRAAYALLVDASRPVRIRAAAPGAPAFRLLYR